MSIVNLGSEYHRINYESTIIAIYNIVQSIENLFILSKTDEIKQKNILHIKKVAKYGRSIFISR